MMKHLSLLTGLDLSLSLSLSHLSITIFTLMYFNETSGLKHSLDTPNIPSHEGVAVLLVVYNPR